MTRALTKIQPCVAGLSLLTLCIIWLICRVDNVDLLDCKWGDVSTVKQIEEIHDSITNKRTSFLIISAILWISLIPVLLHVYYMGRVYDTLFSASEKNNSVDCCIRTYSIVWIFQALIVCILMPGLLVAMAYYSWDFVNDDSNVGYYVQYLLTILIIEVSDAVYLSSAIVAIIPWYIIKRVLYSGDNKYSHTFRSELCCCGCGNIHACKYFLGIFIILILFFSISAFFDWSDSGFWSSEGGSQYFGGFVLVSYFSISIWLFWIASKIKTLQDEKPIAITGDMDEKEEETLLLL